MTPFFTVIIPTLNEEKTLTTLLEDLAKQTFTSFSVIIVDGHSEDKTVENATKFKHKFLGFEIITSKKRHVGYQRNIGAKHATTNWIIFSDADNRIPSHYFQGIKYRVDAYDPDILITWIKADTKDKKDQAFATLANVFHEVQKKTNNPYMLEACVCTKKSSFLKLKGFDESLGWGEGSDLVRRAVRKKMKFIVSKDPRYTYSLRRLRKQGTLKTARNLAVIELARLRKIQLPIEQASYLYPMEGGTYFDFLDKQSTSRIRKIVNWIYNSSAVEKIKPKSGILAKFFRKEEDKNFG